MMHRYGFIRNGARVRWNDPAIGDVDPEERADYAARVFTVTDEFYSENPPTDYADLVYITNDGVEIEVMAGELVPVKRLFAPTPEEIDDDVKAAPAWLLSCLRHADSRMRRAEKETDSLRKENARLLSLSKEERKQLKKDALIAELDAKMKAQDLTIAALRSMLEFYMPYYFTNKGVAPVTVDELLKRK